MSLNPWPKNIFPCLCRNNRGRTIYCEKLVLRKRICSTIQASMPKFAFVLPARNFHLLFCSKSFWSTARSISAESDWSDLRRTWDSFMIMSEELRRLHAESGYGLRSGLWPTAVFTQAPLAVSGWIFSVSTGLLKIVLSKPDCRGCRWWCSSCMWKDWRWP